MTAEKERPAPSACPDDTELLAFSLGQLEDNTAEMVGNHVLWCPRCGHKLEALNGSEDSVVTNLRRFLGRATWVKPDDFGRLEARAKAVLGPVEAAPPTVPEDDGASRRRDLPTRLGKYELARELGRGGMGVVFAAFHTELNKRFALKLIHPAALDNSQSLARFRREIRALGDLNHLHIVAATNAGEEQGRHFLVMEFVDGYDLAALLRRRGPLPVADACEVVRQAAVGLQYVHERGWIHRDIKPSNLMLTRDGVVKILDLGLARVFAEEVSTGELTRSDQAMGTTDYMAPEQWEGGGASGHPRGHLQPGLHAVQAAHGLRAVRRRAERQAEQEESALAVGASAHSGASPGSARGPGGRGRAHAREGARGPLCRSGIRGARVGGVREGQRSRRAGCVRGAASGATGAGRDRSWVAGGRDLLAPKRLSNQGRCRSKAPAAETSRGTGQRACLDARPGRRSSHVNGAA